MKKIVRIKIDNYKAYIKSRLIDNPDGNNVLLYGENGSGKSSLYKAIRFFLSSSVGNGYFECNKYSGRPDGRIELTYSDVEQTTGLPVSGSEKQYFVSNDVTQSTNAEPFIQLSYRVSGFLDYTQLLEVYYKGGKRPDLFNLVVNLLGDYIPIKHGMTTPLKDEKNNLLKELCGAYHRSDWSYKRAVKRFEDWNKVFSELIAILNEKVQILMTTYFPDMEMGVEIIAPSVSLEDVGRIQDAYIDGHVYVDVKHYGQKMTDYNETLNEARLSAIAICLYLASLKMRADNIESKILYLDDIFLGLDLGNRKPVLDIILNEFNDYQVFISTYDRSWYMQAKEILEDWGGWQFYELFEGTTESASGKIIACPIVVKDDSYYERACSFLNNNEYPDYPAAANYLRKAYEELLQKHFYEPAIREEQCEMIPAFKLTQLADACRVFVKQLPDYCIPLKNMENKVTELIGLLRPLLHPLSHYAPDIPVYKAEVVQAIRLYELLWEELNKVSFSNHVRVFQEKGKKGIFEIKGSSGWRIEYSVKLLNHLYLYDDNNGNRIISKGICRITHITENNPGKSKLTHTIGEKDKLAKVLRYDSLKDCYDNAFKHLLYKENKTDIIVTNLKDCIFFPDEMNNFHTLDSMIHTFVW